MTRLPPLILKGHIPMTHTFATTNLVIEASIEGNKLWVADFFSVENPTPDRVVALLKAPARLFHSWRDLTEWCVEHRVIIEQAFQLGPELSDEERGGRVSVQEMGYGARIPVVETDGVTVHSASHPDTARAPRRQMLMRYISDFIGPEGRGAEALAEAILDWHDEEVVADFHPEALDFAEMDVEIKDALHAQLIRKARDEFVATVAFAKESGGLRIELWGMGDGQWTSDEKPLEIGVGVSRAY